MKHLNFVLLIILIAASGARAQWDFGNAVQVAFATPPLTKNLAVDADGNAHTAFRNGSNVRYYVRNEATGQWSAPETVTDSSSAGQIGEISIAWNPDTQQPVIAFQSDARIWFAARQAGGTWSRTMMGDSTEDAYSPDVAVNSVGTIYVVYITDDEGDYQLEYGYYNGLTWEFNDIEAEIGDFGLGAAPRIAVDEQDAGHVVFRGGNFSGYNAQHATNEAGGSTDWIVTGLVVPHAESYPGDISVDGDGGVHCVSSGSEGFGIPRPVYYHYRSPVGDWTFGTAASGTSNAGEPVLALDGAGNPHVMCLEISGNFYTGTLFYSSSLGNWQTQNVYGSTDGAVGFALDGEGYGRVLIPSVDGFVYYLESDTAIGEIGAPAPELTITPPLIDFDSVEVGQDSIVQVELRNTGNATLTISDFVVSGNGFAGPPQWIVVNLEAGAFMTTEVQFAPTSERDYEGFATVTSNASSSPDTIPLQGIGFVISDAPDIPLPLAFELKPLYPNPFNGAVNVSFTLPRASDVSLRVFDVLGREVSTLLSGSMSAGLHMAQWNCAECAAGIYLFKLEVSGASAADAAAFVQKAAFVK
ncbi:T9SS type A sorting domain-containing protein [bacterium]|nr:T9SS type A sorting domain-containing protein [bacterium]